MCGLIISGLGLAMSAYGAMQASQAQQDEANYQAAVQRNNQVIAARNADEIQSAGNREANTRRRNVRDELANQTVSLAAQGGDVTVGSNVDLLADAAEFGELDAETIENNAAKKAHAERVNGMNFGAQAGLFENRADNINPGLRGATTLLSGAGNVAAKWKVK